jgi:hypothetical protein
MCSRETQRARVADDEQDEEEYNLIIHFKRQTSRNG